MNSFCILENNSSLFSEFKIGWEGIANDHQTLFYKSERSSVFDFDGKKIVIIGDYWGEKEAIQSFSFSKLIDIFKKLKGSYYFFVVENDSISVFTGFLALWPIYYSDINKVVTSHFPLFKNSEIKTSISEIFILESFLFNHSFTDSTIYKEVKQLGAHEILKFHSSGTISNTVFFDCSTLFIDKPYSTKASHKKLTDAFINTVKEYIPNADSIISFTGGFDGRTIVSSALKSDIKFNSFSFGRNENDDVSIPKYNAQELGLSYQQIEPSKQYTEKYYAENALEMCNNLGGFNGFLYPHFLFMSKELSSKYKTMVMGYGGSELLRASHIFGAITSKALFYVISIENREEMKARLLEIESISLLNKELIKNNIESLLDEIFIFKNKSGKLKTQNEKLNYYMLENTFRKIFGSWQFSQSQYINVRSPFLDFNFVSELFSTKFAGVYNDFFTDNPVKRFKGQFLYAKIIKASNNIILNQKTGKGYRPNQLLSLLGKLSLLYPFLLKRLKRKTFAVNLDNLGIISGIKSYNINNKVFEYQYFNNILARKYTDELNQYTPERKRDAILNYYSINSFISNE